VGRKKKHKSLAELTCEAKVAWPSRRTAERARKHHTNCLDFFGKDRQPLTVYRCPVCKQWHSGREDVKKNRLEKHERRRYEIEKEALGGSDREL